jgi:hypothetical protein
MRSDGGAIKCWGDNHFGQLANARILVSETPQTVVIGDEIFHDEFDIN